MDVDTGEVIADGENYYKTVLKTEESYTKCKTGVIRQTIKFIKNHGKHEIQRTLF